MADTYVKGDEFVRRLLRGESIFENIELERNFNLNQHSLFSALQEYLRSYIVPSRRLSFNYSIFAGLKAKGLYLPCLNGTCLELSQAELDGATLDGAFFSGAILNKTSFKGASMVSVNFDMATLIGTKFNKANLTDANFHDSCASASFEEAILVDTCFDSVDLVGANLNGADIRGTRFRRANVGKGGLDNCVNLHLADTSGMIVVDYPRVYGAKR